MQHILLDSLLKTLKLVSPGTLSKNPLSGLLIVKIKKD